ncbi:MAG: DJ-1/PfpI family protein [Kiritimatiellia bacterium]|nr:DJ-1/PfpI family protein [Kiritimatiellia bacterium]
MTLSSLAHPPPNQNATVRTVGILLFDGVELLDFAGPAEVFIVAAEGRAFQVLTIAESAGPIRTMGGIEILPSHTVSNAPPVNIVIVPGGNMQSVTQVGIDWIRKAHESSEVTMSVCMGAFLLARAGLLDGIEATTHTWGLENLRRAAPACRVVTGLRYVESGKFLTTAGVTAGIDASLHLVERWLGPEAARWTSEGWMEYQRQTADKSKTSKSSRSDPD